MDKAVMSKAYELAGMFFKGIEPNSLSDKIKLNNTKEKIINEMMKQPKIKELPQMVQHGSIISGKTIGGIGFKWIGNCGMEMRSRYCGTLIIEGKTVFTSGTISRAIKYLLEN